MLLSAVTLIMLFIVTNKFFQRQEMKILSLEIAFREKHNVHI